MVRKRCTRKSGYITPAFVISKKELLYYDLFLNEMYDDWEDWRDGFREWYKDFKTIKNIPVEKKKVDGERYDKRMRMNEKQKRLLKIRKVRRFKIISFSALSPAPLDLWHYAFPGGQY